MSETPTQLAYTKRFNAVLAYIQANLEGDLSVNTLSRVANFSAFHFHRQFTAFVGVPVSRYVQLMRLRRAAHSLATAADYSVLEAALSAGFDSPGGIQPGVPAGVRYGAECVQESAELADLECGVRYPSLFQDDHHAITHCRIPRNPGGRA